MLTFWRLADRRRRAHAAERGCLPRRRLCYVHIGTHKTGTTSIQCLLTGNAERFAAQRLVFPAAGRDEERTVAHHELARELLHGATAESDGRVLQSVTDELRRTQADTVCLSSENFSFLYDAPRALCQLRDAILSAGFEPRILVYLRAQTSYCSAVFAENVRQGYRISFERYLSDILAHGTYTWNGGRGQPFDYRLLLDGFATVFGREAIIARAYRAGWPERHLLLSFVRDLLPNGPAPEYFNIPRQRHNASLRFGAVLQRLEVACDIDSSVPFAPLSLAQTARLAARFSRANLLLAQRYRVVVPAVEHIDLARAFPLSMDHERTVALRRARRALAALA